MPITPFLGNQVFDPEIIEAMSSAFTRARASLGLSDLPDRMTELVARQIIEAAQRGFRNDTALYLNVMQEFRSNPQ